MRTDYEDHRARDPPRASGDPQSSIVQTIGATESLRGAVGDDVVDMAVPNFGIQEWMELEPLYELVPNAPRADAGYVSPPPGPGLGLVFDETEARKRPSRDASLPRRHWPDSGVADY
jgi:L-alanine-DL-glutamate epimerase-like enolase superfamily enzyme